MQEREKGAEEILQPYYKMIRDDAMLTSVLYDADFLPEQCRTVLGARHLALLCEVWKKAFPEKYKEKKEVIDYKKRPVLIIDDYNTMVRITRNLLKQIGFVGDIDDANNGTIALEKIGNRDYALVICDWNLGDQSMLAGLDVLRAIRKINQDIPVLMLLGERPTEEMSLAIHNGASDTMVKPFGSAQLALKIGNIFNKE